MRVNNCCEEMRVISDAGVVFKDKYSVKIQLNGVGLGITHCPWCGKELE